MPNNGNFEDEEPLVGQDPEQGFTNPNIPQNEIDAAMDNDDAASMISGQDGAIGTQEIMEKGAEGQSQPMSETLKQVGVPPVFEKKEEAPVKKDEGGTSMLMSAAIVVSFIAADCGKILFEQLGASGHSTFNQASFLAFVSLINIGLSLGSIVAMSGKEGLKTAFGPSLMLFILPSAMFAGSQLMNILQNSEITSDLRKVFQQLRIPMTAIFSKFVMGHGYTSMQWYLILMVVFCVFSFQIATNKAGVLFDASGDNNIGMGLFLSILANVFACFGSLLAEKYCKDASKTPFYIQKFQIELWTFAASILNIFTLQMAVGWLGDAIFADGKKRFEKNNVFNYKTMQFAHKPFATTRPWSTPTLPFSQKVIQFGNMYDTAAWESKWDETMASNGAGGFTQTVVPNTYPVEKFDEPQYQELIEVIKQLAAVQQKRRAGDIGYGVDNFDGRVQGPLFNSLIAGESPLWKVIATEGKFVVSHGFAPVQGQMTQGEVRANFGFTFGAHNDKAGLFESESPAQRPTPRLTSWWLKKPSDSHLFATEEPTLYFTHKKNIQQDYSKELQSAQKEKSFDMGDKAPLAGEQQGVQVTTYKKAAVYDTKTKKMYLVFDESVEKVWETSTVQLSCTTPGKRLVLTLQCGQQLDFSGDEKLVAKDVGKCRAGKPVYETPKDQAEKCKLEYKDYHKLNDAKGKAKWDAEQKEKAKKKKKDKEDKKKAPAAKKEEMLRAEMTKMLPIDVKDTGKGVEASTHTASDKTGNWMENSPYDFMPLPTEGKEYQAFTYPGTMGAGFFDSKAKSFVCDQRMCDMPDDVWDANYGYMSNHWKNRPQNPTGAEARKNPFAWGEMHGWTLNVMPGAVWGRYVYLALISNIAQSWLSGLVAKTLSSLWKTLCQAVALALVIIVQRLTDEVTAKPQTIGLVGGPKWLESIVGMSSVLLIVWTFSQAPKAPKKH